MKSTVKQSVFTVIAIGAACCASAQFDQESAVLVMSDDVDGVIAYETGKRLDFLALVKPVGEPVVSPLPRAQSMWIAKQEFVVLDSSDFQGSTITAYYYVHAVRNPEGGRYTPAKPLPLDEGKYLLVGRKQSENSVQFDFAVDRIGPAQFAVEHPEELNVTITGLFAVNEVSWAEGGPRWRFVYETIAVNMAHARSGALGDMTTQLRRLFDFEPPKIPGENLDGSKRTDAQASRYGDILRNVIRDTEATATAQDKVYYQSVLLHYEQSEDVKAFIDAMYNLILDEEGDMPESFAWPSLRYRAVAQLTPRLNTRYGVPKGEYQGKLLDIAENASAAKTRGYAFGNVTVLKETTQQRRYYALITEQSPTGRVLYYQKLIDWRKISGIQIEVERSRGGVIVRILNETAVRARISQSLDD